MDKLQGINSPRSLAKVSESSNGLLTPAVNDDAELGPLSEGLILDAIYKKEKCA